MRTTRHRRTAATLLSLSLAWFCAPWCAGQPHAPELASPDRTYSLRLTSYVPAPGQVEGLLLKAGVNGGPLLRLLLDTGAAHVVLSRAAAAKSGFSATSNLALVGFGALPATDVKSGMARSIEIGSLKLRNYPVDVAPDKLPEGLDGVIPVGLFRGFLIRVDLPGKTLELAPYSEEPPAADGFVRAVPTRDLLFVPATLNQAHKGYVLLDTGAVCSVISRQAARDLNSLFLESEEMQGGSGPIAGRRLASGIRFQIAGRELAADPVMAVDLSSISRFHGFEIAGLVGYPDLRTSVITVNYRDSLVSIEPGRKSR